MPECSGSRVADILSCILINPIKLLALGLFKDFFHESYKMGGHLHFYDRTRRGTTLAHFRTSRNEVRNVAERSADRCAEGCLLTAERVLNRDVLNSVVLNSEVLNLEVLNAEVLNPKVLDPEVVTSARISQS